MAATTMVDWLVYAGAAVAWGALAVLLLFHVYTRLSQALLAEARKLRDERDRLRDGIRDAADEIIDATGVHDHYLAEQLLALLDGPEDDDG